MRHVAWGRRWRRGVRDERGSTQIVFILTVVALVVIVGLVVDGAGKVQTAMHAQQVAASAARAATGALAGDALQQGLSVLDAERAEQVALDYLEESSLTGTVIVRGDEVDVHVSTTYDTVFLSLIGITTLPATGTATASLRDG